MGALGPAKLAGPGAAAGMPAGGYPAAFTPTKPPFPVLFRAPKEDAAPQ